jgi:phospholipase C
MSLLRNVLNRFKSRISGDPKKHVVVLMFENHSFDQMLGCFRSEPGSETLNGVDPKKLRTNKDSSGREYWQRQSNNRIFLHDPRHELNHVTNQLENGNTGFVLDYEQSYPDILRPRFFGVRASRVPCWR